MSGNWIAVASAAHVRIGQVGGFMQVCHGKAAPLRRIKPGDCVAYYSPAINMGDKSKFQTFTALGIVKPGDPYSFDMGTGFCPYRRDVHWYNSVDAHIAPLLEKLEFTAGQRNWGYQLRFGFFQISATDMRDIAAAMNVVVDQQLESNFTTSPLGIKISKQIHQREFNFAAT